MTTIAWDGSLLAADCCSWSGGVRRKVRKVFKIARPSHDEILVAFTGYGSFCTAVRDWMLGGDKPSIRDFSSTEDIGSQCAVVIDRDLQIWLLGNDLVYQKMDEIIFACGAGQEFAWGALEAGASSILAIEIAEKRSDYAGLGVDYVAFDFGKCWTKS